MKTSKKNSLDQIDREKRLRNTMLFLASGLVVFMTALQQGVPIELAAIALYKWAFDTVLDLTKKFLADNQQG